MTIETLVAGDTLDMSGDRAIEVPDYPASDGWTLKYRLTPRFASPVQAPITLTATTDPDGSRYNVQAGPATTATWIAGFYSVARWVEKAGARQTLSGLLGAELGGPIGQLKIYADPALTAQGFDSRSHARKTLEAIEAVIEGRATKDQEEYTIGGRALKRTPIEELVKLRGRYKAEVAGEEMRAGGGGGKLVYRL